MDTVAEGGGLPFRMEPGQRFAGKYLVERLLGAGAMGVVVAALHEQLGQTVAIKLLSVPKDMEPEAIGRFFREARAAAALRSEHTARVVDVGIDEFGQHFIVMEHLEGEDLSAVLRVDAPRSIATSVGCILHACEAIAEAHALGIIHRDLKPENLFLTMRLDGYPLIKVLDFGVSKMLEASVVRRAGDDPAVSASGSLVGTPLYMSPEQIRTPATVDGRSDIWSLGVILYELVTGRRPFGGETVADVIASILIDVPAAPVSLRADVPTRLSDLILACLEKDVDRRIANVGILAEGLRPWAPRWARDAAVRAARIAGQRRLGLDDTGPYQTGTHDTHSAELPVVSDGPARALGGAAPADPKSEGGTAPRIQVAQPVAVGQAAAEPRSAPRGGPPAARVAKRRHVGWMALGFGSAMALFIALVGLVPAGMRSARTPNRPGASAPATGLATTLPAAPPMLPLSATSLHAALGPALAPSSDSQPAAAISGRAEARATLPATTGFLAGRVGRAAELRPHLRPEMTNPTVSAPGSSSRRPRGGETAGNNSYPTRESAEPLPAHTSTPALADPLGTRH